MSEINYQALRDAAEKATKGSYIVGHTSVNQHGNLTGVFVCQKWKGEPGGVIAECHVNCLVETDAQAYANAEFIAAFNPNVALALLDEINALEETRINDVCRIAELEKSEEQLINERDHAEYALADMYFAATGNRPEWSNWFGFSDAVDAVVDRIADLEAKQPSPVVPEEMYWQDAPVEGSSKAAAYATGCNACRADMLQGDEPVSNHEELPLDYLQGQKDGLEWAAQLAEANHPQTCDWLYDDPVELAKAIRKGPDMPEAAGN
ncbi:TPA: ead/Ea22-like family protein, partial [Escherichia coli]